MTKKTSSSEPERHSMIYHVPYPLDYGASSASGIRPVKMREAFETLGFDVYEVSGTARQRARHIRNLKRLIRAGREFSFVYSESSSLPTALTESHHLPIRPRMDIAFLRFCKKRGIATGLFYRDIYWTQAAYVESVPRILAMATRFLYRADLRGYETAVDTLFLPSMRMAEFLPEANQAQAHPLPPGAEIIESDCEIANPALLYVGGTGNYYRMQEAVAGVEATQLATLTICTRKKEWAHSQPEYADVLGNRTTVVHRSGDALNELYASTNLCVLLMEPIGYRDFAAPLKLYEYLGHGKPVIATEGTLAANFVLENDVGWALPYEREKLTELLDTLTARPELLREKAEQARRVRHGHTWLARAQQAADALRQPKPGNRR